MTKVKQRGRSASHAPFFCHEIVPCLDLVQKVLSKVSVPRVLAEKNDLVAQMCYDLACSIMHRLEDASHAFAPKRLAEERQLWEARGGAGFKDAYMQLQIAKEKLAVAHVEEELAREFARFPIPSVWEENAPFQELCKKYSIQLIKKGGIEHQSLERATMIGTQDAQIAEMVACATLDQLKWGASFRSSIYESICDFVIEHYEEIFNVNYAAMLELSDVSPRLALLEGGGWMGNFWEEANRLIREPRSFQPETYALRYMQSAEYVIKTQVEDLKDNEPKKSLKQLFDEWARLEGSRFGIKAPSFNHNTAFTACIVQDGRLDKFFRSLGYGGLKQYLGKDKSESYMMLERHLHAGLLRADNQYSTLVKRLDDPTVIINLGDLIGSVYPDKNTLLRKMQRTMQIRL